MSCPTCKGTHSIPNENPGNCEGPYSECPDCMSATIEIGNREKLIVNIEKIAQLAERMEPIIGQPMFQAPSNLDVWRSKPMAEANNDVGIYIGDLKILTIDKKGLQNQIKKKKK